MSEGPLLVSSGLHREFLKLKTGRNRGCPAGTDKVLFTNTKKALALAASRESYFQLVLTGAGRGWGGDAALAMVLAGQAGFTGTEDLHLR